MKESTVGFVLLALLFLGLKAIDAPYISSLSWWWVCAPLAAAAVWWDLADRFGYTKRKEMEKMDLKKEARRQRQLEAIGQGDIRKKK